MKPVSVHRGHAPRARLRAPWRAAALLVTGMFLVACQPTDPGAIGGSAPASTDGTAPAASSTIGEATSTAAPVTSSAAASPSATKPPATTKPATPGPDESGYSCVQTEAQGKCYYPANAAITGTNGDPFINQNIWSGDDSYKQTLYSKSPTDWYVKANAPSKDGAVLTYPNVGWNATGKVDDVKSIRSSWKTTIPHEPGIAAWAAYDLWFNDWEDEVMIQTDLAVTSAYDCDHVASATFDGMPWHLCVFGKQRVWKPGTDDQHLINQPTGSLEIQPMLLWMEKNGYLKKGSTWTAGSFGFEVCGTSGRDIKLAVTDFTWHAT